MSTRTVTVYSTKGKKTAKIETSAKVWSELRQEVADAGYSVDSLLATESINRTDLNHKDSVLPDQPFTLFLRPKKTKSGLTPIEMSYKECKAKIKELIASDGEPARKHFNENYRDNYTRLTTDELRTALAEYTPATVSSSDEDVEDAEQVEETQNVADVVETVSASKTPSEKVDAAIAFIKEVVEESNNEDVIERGEEVIEELEGFKIEVEGDEETAEEKEARLAEEARLREEKEEQERLDAEAKDLFGGFVG